MSLRPIAIVAALVLAFACASQAGSGIYDIVGRVVQI
jgi:hypothetical protein